MTSPTDDHLNRREFQRSALGTVFSYSLLSCLAGCDVFARELSPIAQAWLRDMQELAVAVKGGQIQQTEWQAQTEALFARVELSELLAMIDFEDVVRRAKFSSAKEPVVEARLPQVAGLPKQLDFGHLVFALERGQAVPPHGHYNMATGFLVLDGQFRARHYDRLVEEDDHMILRPTIDETFVPGSTSTISETKDNVHWFRTESEQGYLFNVHVHHIDPNNTAHGRVFVDPTGELLADGTIYAPKLNRVQSFERFGGDGTHAS